MFKSYSGICLEHIKNKHIITRWMIEKHGYQNWRVMKALQNIYTALLYGKYDSIVVQDSE